MLSIEDLETIITLLEDKEDAKLLNLKERLTILVAQDKANREYQEEMTKYRDRLNELVKNDEEPIEK